MKSKLFERIINSGVAYEIFHDKKHVDVKVVQTEPTLIPIVSYEESVPEHKKRTTPTDTFIFKDCDIKLDDDQLYWTEPDENWGCAGVFAIDDLRLTPTGAYFKIGGNQEETKDIFQDVYFRFNNEKSY